ncbi:guanine deaminase-like isoform X2 [Ptychodera flava]
MPGLIDVHLNAAHYPMAGISSTLPLWDWLKSHAWPTEKLYEDDISFADQVFQKVVERSIGNGTTTACYDAGISSKATIRLVHIVEKHGQRAFIGKSSRDVIDGGGYRHLLEDTDEAIESTESVIKEIRSKDCPLVSPLLSPSSLSTVTMEMMSGFARLSEGNTSLRMQIRVAQTENDEETANGIHGNRSETITGLLRGYGLLSDRTILSHGIFLSDDDISLIKEERAGVVHCPTSDMSTYSGVCDLRKFLDAGVKVGLGTDVGSSHSVSLLDSIRSSILASKALSFQKTQDYESLALEEAFMLATLGGSQVLGIDDKVGSFNPGKEFDALLVDVSQEGSRIDVFPHQTAKDAIHKFLLLGDDRNIKEVYVAGQQIKKPT